MVDYLSKILLKLLESNFVLPHSKCIIFHAENKFEKILKKEWYINIYRKRDLFHWRNVLGKCILIITDLELRCFLIFILKFWNIKNPLRLTKEIGLKEIR